MTARDELEKFDREWLVAKERYGPVSRLQLFATIGWFCIWAGVGLVVLGVWLNDLGEDVRLERLLHPWPAICMVLGVCVAVGSLVLTFGYVHPRLRAFLQARCSYDKRREELLEEIYGRGQDPNDAGKSFVEPSEGETAMPTRVFRIFESIGRLGNGPITQSNWRKPFLVVVAVITIPILIVAVTESRRNIETDLPPAQLNQLKVTEFHMVGNIQTEKDSRGHTITQETTDVGVRVSIQNSTNWRITSFTIRLSGTNADGQPSSRDIDCDKGLLPKPRRRSPWPIAIEIPLGGAPNDFKVDGCDIIKARGIAP